ncbi:MAG: hypothetical protein ACAI43_24260, partial [Phycisphaerae bacterium]|nr:hypothetical protein [Tepidisphaeraceae bacterium]
MSEEKRKNDAADALAALAGGFHVEDHPAGSGVDAHAHDDISTPPPPTPVAPPKAKAPAPTG